MALADTRPAEDNRRIGALAAFGIAAMPVYFILPRVVGEAFGAKDPTGQSLDVQVATIIAHPNVYGSLGLASVVVGLCFMVLALALHGHLGATAPFAMRVATAAGAIGGALFFTAGFMPLSLASRLVEIDAQDHAAAVALYVTGPTVVGALTSASTVLLGLFAAIATTVGARSGMLPRALSYVGMLLLLAFVATLAVPPVLMLTILLLVVWAVWLGIALLRRRGQAAAPAGATSAARA